MQAAVSNDLANVRNGSKADILDNRHGSRHLGPMRDSRRKVRDEISVSIRHYLDVLEGANDCTLYDLAKALDELVATYHRVADVEPDTTEASAAPRPDEKRIVDAATAKFPDLGWYALVDPEGAPDQQVGMSIAASDLAEIASDLMGVLWLFENGSHNDAVWDFRFGYQSHWGRHLHELRTYLHSLAAW
jgi:hypothetical protein